MTVEEMHYDFKMKFNKLDTQQYRNLLIPEIDFLLNEAQELFVKRIAFPRDAQATGFEVTQRVTDDIRVLVERTFCNPGSSVYRGSTAYPYQYVNLPSNYWHFIRADVSFTSQTCGSIQCGCHVRQHDDMNHLSPFDRSDLSWREVNILFEDGRIQVEMPQDYEQKKAHLHGLSLVYLRSPRRIHYAQGFNSTEGYKSLDGVLLRGKQDCELPAHTHREIVDLAIMNASLQIGKPEMQSTFQKVMLNQPNQK